MSEGKAPPSRPSSASATGRRDDDDDRFGPALAAWPMVEQSARASDASAEAIMARLGDASDAKPRGGDRVSDEALLAPPLAQTAEEVQNSAALGIGEASRRASSPSISVASEAGKMGQSSEQSKRASRRQSLKELAELARNSQPGSGGFAVGSGVHPLNAGESQPGTAGLFDDDARDARDPQSMRPSAPPARPSDHAEAARASGSADDVLLMPPPYVPMSLPPMPEHVAASESYAPALPASGAPPRIASRQRGAWLYGTLGVGAVAAAAAGLLFVMRAPHGDASLASSPLTTTTGAATGAKALQAAPEVQLLEGDPNGAPAATATGTMPLVPTLLPLAPASPIAFAPTTTTTAAKTEAPAANGATAPGAVATADTAAAPPPPAPPAPPPASGDPKSLQDQMRQAAGQSAPVAPAVDSPSAPTGTPQNVPMKPSQGAASGAVGAVLYSARACLGPDDPVSQATVVFQSSGAVQSVSVSGGAAGKPQEACIKQSLGRAKVAPFAQPSFAFSVTIRPN